MAVQLGADLVWQSVFTHAAKDLLFLLTMELPRNAVQELNERSLAWPVSWFSSGATFAMGLFSYFENSN